MPFGAPVEPAIEPSLGLGRGGVGGGENPCVNGDEGADGAACCGVVVLLRGGCRRARGREGRFAPRRRGGLRRSLNATFGFSLTALRHATFAAVLLGSTMLVVAGPAHATDAGEGAAFRIFDAHGDAGEGAVRPV